MNRAKTGPHCAEYTAHRSPAFNPVEFDGFRKQAGLALFIGHALPQPERLTRLNQIAIGQMKLLTTDDRTPQLPEGKKGK